MGVNPRFGSGLAPAFVKQRFRRWRWKCSAVNLDLFCVNPVVSDDGNEGNGLASCEERSVGRRYVVKSEECIVPIMVIYKKPEVFSGGEVSDGPDTAYGSGFMNG